MQNIYKYNSFVRSLYIYICNNNNTTFYVILKINICLCDYNNIKSMIKMISNIFIKKFKIIKVYLILT